MLTYQVLSEEQTSVTREPQHAIRSSIPLILSNLPDHLSHYRIQAGKILSQKCVSWTWLNPLIARAESFRTLLRRLAIINFRQSASLHWVVDFIDRAVQNLVYPGFLRKCSQHSVRSNSEGHYQSIFPMYETLFCRRHEAHP